MTDWGPGARWLFREHSAQVKTRVIAALVEEHPQLSWVLVGDSRQDDPQAYAAVARAHPDQVLAIYIRLVPGTSTRRSHLAQQLSSELSRGGRSDAPRPRQRGHRRERPRARSGRRPRL